MSSHEIEDAIEQVLKNTNIYMNYLLEEKLFLTHLIFENHINERLERYKKIRSPSKRYRLIFDTTYYMSKEIHLIVKQGEFHFEHPNPEIIDNIYHQIDEMSLY